MSKNTKVRPAGESFRIVMLCLNFVMKAMNAQRILVGSAIRLTSLQSGQISIKTQKSVYDFGRFVGQMATLLKDRDIVTNKIIILQRI